MAADAEDRRWRLRHEGGPAGGEGTAAAAPVAGARAAHPEQPAPLAAEDVGLHGVGDASALKDALRTLLLRWHSDKFASTFGGALEPADAPAVLARVTNTAARLIDLRERLLSAAAAAPGVGSSRAS